MHKNHVQMNPQHNNVLIEVSEGLSRLHKELIDLNKDILATYNKLVRYKHEKST